MSNVQLNSFEDILSYASADFSEVRAWLVQQIDYLFHHDMEKLKWVLYRIDVNESKLKQLLIDNSQQKLLPMRLLNGKFKNIIREKLLKLRIGVLIYNLFGILLINPSIASSIIFIENNFFVQ